MCGIVGRISFSDKIVNKDMLISMRDTLVHRGPDAEGVWISKDRKAGLAHRRLSIIDLSDAANQPMSNEDESVVVVFNGEIYNHAEIRKELEESGGFHWKTDHSDTEVIVHSFERWGIDCVHKFRGMFAIAIWDSRRKELWLVRDRVGIKPLYYTSYNKEFIFASEIKAILKDPALPRKMNEEGFFHFLSFLVVPAPDTMFDGIKKVPPGTWLKIRENGDIESFKYWDVLDHTENLNNVSENEIIERIVHELRYSVELRKISDVPVGVFLSGGVDSSINARLFSEGENAINTFSVAYSGEFPGYPSELPYARLMAEHVGSNHYDHDISVDECLEFISKMVYHQDEPIADKTCIPTYYVSKLAKENGVTVCQVGEGADELFFGYPDWRKLLLLQRFYQLPLPYRIKDMPLKLLSKIGKIHRLDYWLGLTARVKNEIPMFWSGAEPFTGDLKFDLLSERLRKRFKGYSSYEIIRPLWDKFNEERFNRSEINWFGYADLNIRLPELLLMRVDKMSMAVSLECRVPFLDHKLVELAFSIPERLKIKNGTPKYILKKAAMLNQLVPDQLIKRKKQGFSLPITDMYSKGSFGKSMENTIAAFCENTDLLDKKYIASHFNNLDSSWLWPLFNVAVWHKTFIS